MPRVLRSDFAGQIYHALNRGNGRNKIFLKDGDFEAFERVVREGLEKYRGDLISYQWMSNQWHMVLSQQHDKAMSAFPGWVTKTHIQRYHAHNKSTVTSTKGGTRAFQFRTMITSTPCVVTLNAMP